MFTSVFLTRVPTLSTGAAEFINFLLSYGIIPDLDETSDRSVCFLFSSAPHLILGGLINKMSCKKKISV